jgi:hypothetical protein
MEAALLRAVAQEESNVITVRLNNTGGMDRGRQLVMRQSA